MSGPSGAGPLAPVQTPRYQEKREAILDAAVRRFDEHGVRGATLADIAGSVGLVTNSVTYYYRKKEDLATACFERSIAAFDALATQAGAAADDVPQRLQHFFGAYAQRLADIEAGRHPPLLSFNDIRALPAPHDGRVFAAYTDMFRRVRGLLKGPSTRALGREDLNARAHLVLSVAHALRNAIGRHETDEYPRIAARVVDHLLRGLPATGAAWPPVPLAEPPWRLGPEAGGTLDAFLRAATVLVNEQGYRGASVDKISARLNVTKGSFYHHHDTKHDLITECFERSFGVMRQALRRAEDGPGTGWSRAGAAARALVHFQLSDDGPLLRATATSALPDQAHRRRVTRTLHRLGQRYASVLVDGMVDGSIRPLDPTVAAEAVIACINAAAELHRWLPAATVDSIDAQYVRPMLEGVLCPPSVAAPPALGDLPPRGCP
ncbi:TetR/AcrR family transcriptional regulator [Piscinibacter sakaiensis]|uniref:Transcriptional regulator, TetR family n=1 Tax=Piscinibacter sakaiensis TaxID=1547922 RepID=A0A0K8P529_PISS1|nr:TetR/AcrR family transcriptional regulator [Piscinibacter sakaiensis]GAP37671.1 transcriptional regulator, TetR family [Piscinibacter sakaiensis]